MAQTQPRNLAFHVTAKDNVESIFKHGILSPKSQGWNPKVEGWDALKARGFKFNFTFDPIHAHFILGSTFVRRGGVEGHRYGDAIFAVCMDTLAALGVDCGEDRYGSYDAAGVEIMDTEVWGDIPPAAIVGRVSLGWMARNGYATEDPRF